MNKNNKVDIEEIKNYLLEQIKINNSDIDRNIEKIRKENSVENLKNALQYFRKLVDSFGSYIYIYIYIYVSYIHLIRRRRKTVYISVISVSFKKKPK
ncbi:hypothetical protein [Mesomycoplasma hyorhinis]|uniref:hypothetical protein n=2 Tax=Mesomycoplasma hyorhinis TaxID=2100 RepID=UPI001F358D22|nr:hypothetical protein [Mesomycoplasma hyorhinis]